MGTCSQTNIPDLNVVEESCNGYYPPTRCIIHEPALTALGIPANTSLENIITAIVSALNIQSVTINNLSSEIENQQTEIESLQEQIDDLSSS
jgi:peptidoglycan hydrolase CwlO-like protein